MSFNTAIETSLRSGLTAYGFWLTLPSAALAKTILRSAIASQNGGFNWVLIDAEHGLITDRDYYELSNAIGSERASPIIRVPWGEEWMIKRALDAGAHGIMTPMCHTPEDAANIVKYSKYPPQGTRGYGPMFSAHSFPGVTAGSQYDDGANRNLMVIVQIESKEGVENVENIAGVDGVDVIFIGPFDLAKQLGVAHGGEEHSAAIQRILNAAKAATKKAAIFCTDGVQARAYAEQGFDMVSIITDVGVIGNGMMRELEAATGKALGEEKKPGESY